MKKIVIVLFIILFCCSCSNKKDVLTCDIFQSTVTITLKNGKIYEYVDSITGNLDNKKIEDMNNEYLKGVDSNKEAKDILKVEISKNGGLCK